MLPYVSGQEPTPKTTTPRQKKFKYHCIECGTEIWALTETLHAQCYDCCCDFQLGDLPDDAGDVPRDND